MKFEQERKTRALKLTVIWGISILLSVSAMVLSTYVLTRDRIDYSCERNGHSYEPRYETVPPSGKEIQDLKLHRSTYKLTYVEAMTRRAYVGDVCHYCGKSVRRQ
jgi:hypothetical protein